MGNAEEFLDHYQLCQVSRRCAGIDCPNVSIQSMEQAVRLDDATGALPQACHAKGHDSHSCHDCKHVNGLRNGLMAGLRAGGIEIPPSLF